MKTIFIAFLLIFACAENISGQSIPSYWMNTINLNNFYILRTGSAREITADVLGYYASGETYNEKWVYNSIEKYKIQGERYQENELKLKFTYEFDSLGQTIKNEIESKLPLFGWQTEVHTYEYSEGKQHVERQYDKNNNLVRIIEYQYDSLNNPIKLSIFNNQQQLESYETATYNYIKYKYAYKVFNGNNEMVLKKEEYCCNDTTQNLKNEKGDLVKVTWPLSPSYQPIYYTITYKYDDKGNWIERKMLIRKKKSKDNYSTVKRTIAYKTEN